MCIMLIDSESNKNKVKKFNDYITLFHRGMKDGESFKNKEEKRDFYGGGIVEICR